MVKKPPELDRDNVLSLQSFGAGSEIELDLLPLLELTIAIHLDGREVDEDIVALFVADESIALYDVEPLHSPTDFLL